MSISLDRFFLISLFAIPAANKLSTWIGVAGCGWPISCNVTRIGAAFWSFLKQLPYSDSYTEDIILFMTLRS